MALINGVSLTAAAVRLTPLIRANASLGVGVKAPEHLGHEERVSLTFLVEPYRKGPSIRRILQDVEEQFLHGRGRNGPEFNALRRDAGGLPTDKSLKRVDSIPRGEWSRPA